MTRVAGSAVRAKCQIMLRRKGQYSYLRTLELLKQLTSFFGRDALPQRTKQSAAALREQIEQSRRAAASQIDDMAFRNLLLQSEVLSTRSDIPWRCDILLELVNGPLRDPKRLEETTRATKFMSRLLGFFHPFSLRYSDMPRSTVRPSRIDKATLSVADTFTSSQTPNGLVSVAPFSRHSLTAPKVGTTSPRISSCAKSPSLSFRSIPCVRSADHVYEVLY